jgi:hypothetical protein
MTRCCLNAPIRDTTLAGLYARGALPACAPMFRMHVEGRDALPDFANLP